MKILELFSGTASFSNVARERGHEVFCVDILPFPDTNLQKDIMDLKISDLPWMPDVVWASPPCQTFSVASLRHYWDKGQPKNEKALKGIVIAKKTVEFINELSPKFWIIENPRAMMRKQTFMPNNKRVTVTYCQYGLEYQKATDLWTNIPFNPKPMCSPRSPCHVRAPRGSKTGIQGTKAKIGFHPDIAYSINRTGGSSAARAIVPRELCLEVLKACEAQQ